MLVFLMHHMLIAFSDEQKIDISYTWFLGASHDHLQIYKDNLV